MPSALAHYESFLVNNVGTISTVESTLRSITWILPGRFKDAELASEARQLLIRLRVDIDLTGRAGVTAYSLRPAQCDQSLS